MNQQALVQELTALINAGLKQRRVPIDRPAWVISYTENDGWFLNWQPNVRPGVGNFVTLEFDDLIVFRDTLEIERILDKLPDLAATAERRTGSAGFKAELEELRERMMRQYGSFPEADKRLRELLRELAK